MNRYFRRAFFPALLFLLVMLMTAPAFAVEVRFSDVSVDSPWYEGVEYIAEHGITVGTGEGRYSPDAPITVRQWAVMLCRAFDDTTSPAGDGEFGTTCLIQAHRDGWLSMEAVTEPDTQMCRGALYQSVFKATGLPVYDYELYPGGKFLPVYENCLRIGKEMGLCPEEAETLEIVTRGETAALLHIMLTQEFEIDEPPILGEVPIQNDEGVSMNAYLLELDRVPEPILREFQRRDWIYTVNFQYLADLSKQYSWTCIGATDYSVRRIYVSEAGATLHEFGHFLDSALGFPSSRQSFCEEEAQAASAFLRDYALTNCREYFADYFVYWLEHHDSTEQAAQMQQLTPRTYEYFTHLAGNDWNLVN